MGKRTNTFSDEVYSNAAKIYAAAELCNYPGLVDHLRLFQGVGFADTKKHAGIKPSAEYLEVLADAMRMLSSHGIVDNETAIAHLEELKSKIGLWIIIKQEFDIDIEKRLDSLKQDFIKNNDKQD
jgi:hypothetical protein